MTRLLDRPFLPPLVLGTVAQTLFSWRLASPHQLYFDEVHYVPAARTLWSLEGPANIEHPLLGKALIGLGIAIFGDGPIGWRALSTLAATAVVLGIYALVRIGTGRARTALLAGGLVLLNFTVFVQARIAMLDGYMAAFVVTGAVCLLWAMRGTGGQVWRRWIAGSVLMGLAVAVKWTAVPYVAFAGIALLLLGWRHPARWPGMNRIVALFALGLVSIPTYVASFAPAFFYADQPLTLAGLVPFQFEMLARQTQVLPAHAYQSPWWGWPLLLRPIWYLYEPVDGAVRGVLMLGNPAIMWGGLVAVAACLWGWIRARSTPCGVAAWLWIASVAVWAIIPKSLGFYYYYYLPSIWLCVAIAVAFDRWRLRLRYWDEAFATLAAGLFVHFHPILSAAALDGPQAFHRWMWLNSWP